MEGSTYMKSSGATNETHTVPLRLKVGGRRGCRVGSSASSRESGFIDKLSFAMLPILLPLNEMALLETAKCIGAINHPFF